MRRLLLASSLLWFALSPPASAQERPVRDIVREAVAEFDAGNFAEARALFLEAQAREPSARVLRGAGMASFELREYVIAREYLYAALAEESRALTADQQTEVEDLIIRTEGFLGRFLVTLEPSDAELTVDLRPTALAEDGSLLLDVGEHVLRARAEGHRETQQRITVRGGETLEVTLRLEPEGAEEPGLEAGGGGEPPGRGVDLGLRAGAFGLGLGTIMGAIWWRGRNEQVDVCRRGPEPCLNGPALDGQRLGAVVTTLVLAAGAAGLGVAALVRALDGGGDDERGRARVDCALGVGGVSCAGAF